MFFNMALAYIGKHDFIIFVIFLLQRVVNVICDSTLVYEYIMLSWDVEFSPLPNKIK